MDCEAASQLNKGDVYIYDNSIVVHGVTPVKRILSTTAKIMKGFQKFAFAASNSAGLQKLTLLLLKFVNALQSLQSNICCVTQQ